MVGEATSQAQQPSQLPKTTISPAQLYAHPLPLTRPRLTLTSIFRLPLPHLVTCPKGIYDPLSKSVWVTEEPDVSSLWMRGFFGKGSLSRSEPSWLSREKGRLEAKRKGALTAEEVTAKRRLERKVAKIQKAKEKKETALAIASGLTTPLPASGVATPISNDGAVEADVDANKLPPLDTQIVDTKLTKIDEDPIVSTEPSGALVSDAPTVPSIEEREGIIPETQTKNQEHLQLTREESFFLIWAVGSLSLQPPSSPPSPTPSEMTALQAWSSFLKSTIRPNAPVRPDNPFLISYISYHHLRSLGWVVRSGIKFCVDWVVYKGSDGSNLNLKPERSAVSRLGGSGWLDWILSGEKTKKAAKGGGKGGKRKGKGGGVGPVGGHAEFSVVVIPTYSDPKDKANGEGVDEKSTWQWLATVNRVTSGVKKTLILLYVVIPPFDSLSSDQILADPEGTLKMYQVREVSIRRFVPARMRD